MTNLAAKTKHIRGRLKAAGIKAKCRCYLSCGSQWITINVPTYEAEFSDQEQRSIRTIAQVNGLTFARNEAIEVERMTNPKEFHFVSSLNCHGGR